MNNEENLLFRHLNIIKDLFLIAGVAGYIINEIMTSGIAQPDGTEITRQLFDLDPRCNDQPTILLCWLMRFVRTEENARKRELVFRKVIMSAIKSTPYYNGRQDKIWY